MFRIWLFRVRVNLLGLVLQVRGRHMVCGGRAELHALPQGRYDEVLHRRAHRQLLCLRDGLCGHFQPWHLDSGLLPMRGGLVCVFSWRGELHALCCRLIFSVRGRHERRNMHGLPSRHLLCLRSCRMFAVPRWVFLVLCGCVELLTLRRGQVCVLQCFHNVHILPGGHLLRKLRGCSLLQLYRRDLLGQCGCHQLRPVRGGLLCVLKRRPGLHNVPGRHLLGAPRGLKLLQLLCWDILPELWCVVT